MQRNQVFTPNQSPLQSCKGIQWSPILNISHAQWNHTGFPEEESVNDENGLQHLNGSSNSDYSTEIFSQKENADFNLTVFQQTAFVNDISMQLHHKCNTNAYCRENMSAELGGKQMRYIIPGDYTVYISESSDYTVHHF